METQPRSVKTNYDLQPSTCKSHFARRLTGRHIKEQGILYSFPSLLRAQNLRVPCTQHLPSLVPPLPSLAGVKRTDGVGAEGPGVWGAGPSGCSRLSPRCTLALATSICRAEVPLLLCSSASHTWHIWKRDDGADETGMERLFVRKGKTKSEDQSVCAR